MEDHAAFCPEPMLLRFDSYEDRIAKGRLKILRRQAPLRFDSMDQLFMIIEAVLDAEDFPRDTGAFRHLKMGKKARGQICMFRPPAQEEPSGGSGRTEAEGGGGFKGQMTVTVCRREYSSIQGTVNVKGEKTHFRSALELMHMFHEYLAANFQPARLPG